MDKLKNICIGPAFPYRGGIANFNESLCKAFREQGIDSRIITFTYQYPGFLFPGKTQYDEGEAPDGLPVRRMIHSLNPFSWRKTAKAIISEQPDFVIIHYWMPFMAPALGKIARIIRRKSKIKVIAVTHNVIPHEKRMGDRMLTRYFVRSCDAFVSLAKSVLDDLSVFTSNPNKIFSPHPIYDIFGEKTGKEEARKHLQLDPDARIILFFGIIRPYKGLDILVKAMSSEKLIEMDLQLLVAGEFYHDRHYYTDLISQRGLENNVTISDGYIPKEKVKYYFCAADIVVQPYRSATQSGVTQIAYQFGTPMLVTNVGGLAEIVPHNEAGYVTAVDAGEITEALYDFFHNERWSEFTAGVKKHSEMFSWKTFTDRVIALLQRI